MKKILIVPLLICFVVACAQTKNPDCDLVKDGVFYSRVPDSDNFSKIMRRDGIQTEILNDGKDTAFYKIVWKSSCKFDLEFVRQTIAFEPGEEEFTRQAVISNEILKVTEKYYIVKTRFSHPLVVKDITDTMWMTSPNPNNN